MMEKILQRIEFNTFVQTKDLAAFRIIIGLSFLFIYQPTWNWLGNMPQEFFNPNLFNLPVFIFTDFLPASVFIFIDIIFYILLLFVIIGFYSRYSFFLLFFIGIFANSFQYSFGKIDHDILLWSLLLVMAFTNSGTHFCFKKDRILKDKIQKTSLGLFSLAICFGLFTAGYPKLISWVDFDLTTNGFLRWFYNSYYNYGRTELLAPLVVTFKPWMVELLDYTAVLFEITGIVFLLAGRKYWRFYLLIAILFHLGNILLLNIDFKSHLLVYGVFLVSPFFKRVLERVFKKKKLLRLLSCLVLIQFIIVISKLFFFKTGIFHIEQNLSTISLLFSIALFIGVIIIYLISSKKGLYRINGK